jgi:hypothetical protein
MNKIFQGKTDDHFYYVKELNKVFLNSLSGDDHSLVRLVILFSIMQVSSLNATFFYSAEEIHHRANASAQHLLFEDALLKQTIFNCEK